MDRDSIHGALDEFVNADELRIAALSGSWGVGKTYLWQRYAEQLTVPNKFIGVSYASLFGASSVRDLRAKVTDGLTLQQDRQSVVDRYKDSSKNSLIPHELPGKASGLIRRYISGGLSGLFSDASY